MNCNLKEGESVMVSDNGVVGVELTRLYFELGYMVRVLIYGLERVKINVSREDIDKTLCYLIARDLGEVK